ncbi:MAG: YigZ family protein, partial [Bacteroidales bacterium]|nr:YigZ family protein [Bacteroidales bacterium]
IVVRYFGGIKLGIPGLINAYKIAAKEAIDSNEIIEKIITTTVSVSCPYQNINLVMKFMKDENLNIIAQDYINEQLVITAEVRRSKNDEILDKINSIYGLKIVP